MQSVETIIKAARLIKDDPTIKIHIVGDGRDLEKCKKCEKTGVKADPHRPKLCKK